jgi:Uma2 family endonuclease
LTFYLSDYLKTHDIGFLLGADGMVRVQPRQVRMPDISFYLWERFPGRILPAGAFLDLVPDLAVEMLSPSNTPREMARKLREYFAGGARLVWYVYPESRTVKCFWSVDQWKVVAEDGTLDGGDVLPGFSLALRDWFSRAAQQAQPPIE